MAEQDTALRRRQPHLDDVALAGMSWDALFSLVSSTPRDKHRRRTMKNALLLPDPDRSLSATDQTRRSRTLWALGALVDRLATAQREVVAELLRLEPHEVGTAIRYMSPPNFAQALGIPVHELLDHLQPELLGHLQPTSDASSRPLKMFIRWFHLKRWLSAWQIQRCYRQRHGTYVGPPCFDRHIHLRGKRQIAAPAAPPTYVPVFLRVLNWSTAGPTSAWSSVAAVQSTPEPADEVHAQAPVAEPAPPSSPDEDTLSTPMSHSVLPCASSHSSPSARPATVESKSEIDVAATRESSPGPAVDNASSHPVAAPSAEPS